MKLTERGIKLIPSKVKEMLTFMIKNNERLAEQGLKPIAVNISGAAGLGKTSIIEQVAQSIGKRMVKISLAQLDELGDLVGFPYTAYEMLYPDGSKGWLAETPSKLAINKMQAKYTGRTKMTYALPEWYVNNQDEKNGCILVLDDFSRAQPRFIQAAMEIIDRMEYYSWKLPSNWSVVLTTNPSGEGYHVSGMDVAQETRYAEIHMDFDKEDWAEWAENVGLDGRCINFVLIYPELIEEQLKVGINPRTMVQFFSAIHYLEDFEGKNARRQIVRLGEMTVGNATTQQFSVFIANKEDKLMTPEEMMFHPEDEVLQTMKKQLYDSQGVYRNGVGYALSIRLVNYLTRYVRDHTFTDEMADRLELITLEEVFSRDMNYHIVRTLNQRDSFKFKKFCARQSVVKYNLA